MMTQLITSNAQILTFSVLFLIIGFFLSREIYCWYFKINERNEILRKNQELLIKILNKLNNEG